MVSQRTEYRRARFRGLQVKREREYKRYEKINTTYIGLGLF